MKTIEEFKVKRAEALMSLDENTIRRIYSEFGTKLPDDKDVFWGAIHKAITGLTSLPLEHRRKSKAYLDARGLSSWDDGDL